MTFKQISEQMKIIHTKKSRCWAIKAYVYNEQLCEPATIGASRCFGTLTISLSMIALLIIAKTQREHAATR